MTHHDMDLVWECLPPDLRPGQERGNMHGVDVESVRHATDIVALIGESVRLKKAGKDYQGLCPFHDEKTPSFTVSQEKQFYHCFGCGAHGGVFDWMTQHGQMTFRQALEALAGRLGMFVEPLGSGEAKRRRSVANHAKLEADAWREVLVLEMSLSERVAYRGIDAATKARFPHLQTPPDGPDDRELLAAQRLSDALAALYGAFPGKGAQKVEDAPQAPMGRKTAAEKAAEREAWLRAKRAQRAPQYPDGENWVPG